MTNEAIATVIESRRFGPSMKAALQRVLAGESYRAAAEGKGVDHRGLHRNAGTVQGLREAHLVAWRAGWGRAFPTMWQHHIAKVESEPEAG